MKIIYCFLIFLLAITQANYAFAECNSIHDVLSSANLNSYYVEQQTYFLNKDEDGTLHKTKQYAVDGDYLIAGLRDNNLCAAYISEATELPVVIGFIENNNNIKAVQVAEDEQILGEWFAQCHPIYKYISFSINEDGLINIYGDLHSKVSSMLAYIGGNVFKISPDKYMVYLTGGKEDVYSVIFSANKEKLNYIIRYDDPTSPYLSIFNGSYIRQKNINKTSLKCF